jgi:transcription elongation factor S-II
MSTETESDVLDGTKRSYRSRGQSYLAEYLPPNEAIQLEDLVFAYTTQYVSCYNLNLVHFKSLYNSKIQDLYYNLNPMNSPTLLASILNKKVDITRIPYLSPEELNPTCWESIIKKRDFIEYKKNNTATSDAYECRKCKQRKCKVYSLQTRSADEPMTIFVQCEVCNCSWRIYG